MSGWRVTGSRLRMTALFGVHPRWPLENGGYRFYEGYWN